MSGFPDIYKFFTHTYYTDITYECCEPTACFQYEPDIIADAAIGGGAEQCKLCVLYP